MPQWDPTQYELYARLRTRPFEDLLGRVDLEDPRTVVDLGCGNGLATLRLAQRWPRARIIGVDSSARMLDRARERDPDRRVEWVERDLRDWEPAALGAPELIVTNAALQWVPGHLELIERWVEALAPGGVFAMQVPGNFDAPSHRIIRELAGTWLPSHDLPDIIRVHPVEEPDGYARALAPRCDRLDVWETTYLQILDPSGEAEDPVLEWVKGTALRPILERLDDGDRDPFLAELASRLHRAYPRRDFGTPFPFRRIFAVGRKPPRGVTPMAREGTSGAREVTPSARGVTPSARGVTPSARGVTPGAREVTPSVGARTRHTGSAPGLHHVQLACPAGSEPRLREFYGGVLGLPEVSKPARLAARGGCWFQAGEQQVHLGVEQDFRPARKAHPCLLVGEVDAVAAAVSGAGAPVRWDEAIPGVRRFHTDDPVGNRVEIQQAAP